MFPLTLKFTVTQEHLDNGVPKSQSEDPVSLALVDELPEELDIVSVTEDEVIINNETGEARTYLTTPALSDWIADFDDGFEVPVPITFEVTMECYNV